MEGDREAEKENSPFQREDRPRIMFSNMDPTDKKELNHLLTDMYTDYTTEAAEVTHLIMPCMERTNNFLMALPTVKFVLDPAWIRDSKSAGRWLPEQDFLLKDKKFEEKFEFNLAKLLNNPERNKIFTGKIFYITPSVAPSMKVITSIINTAGGRVENHRRKSPKQIKELNKGGSINYIIITCSEDMHLVTDVLRAKQPIFTPELVFSGLMHCEMDFDLSRYMTTISHDQSDQS